VKILLVEDYAPLRATLLKGLRDAGHTVDAAADGEEGLWFAEGQEFDVIVLDLMLPGIDGLELLRRLREGGRQTHVLILTARDAVEDRVRGLEFGADDYLTKPFAFEELKARINALGRRRFAAKSPALRIGDLEIDRGARRVSRGARTLQLGAKPYALLELLALRAGEVVSREELWSQLYAFDDEPSSNLLEVYVAQLRRKLESEGEPRLIYTHRGVGYQLREPS